MASTDDNVSLMTRYEDQPVLRGLIQLVPFGIGSAVDTALAVRYQTHRADQLREFFDELGAGKAHLTPELVADNDFLHCYFATVAAVLKSARAGKVRYLARLLRSAVTEEKVSSIDEYEELLSIINELSYRELGLLSLLASHERATPLQPGEKQLQRARRLWSTFAPEAEKRFGISPAMLQSILVRLQRSGCYQEITGAYLDYAGGLGHLTSLYFRLEQIAGDIADVAT